MRDIVVCLEMKIIERDEMEYVDEEELVLKVWAVVLFGACVVAVLLIVFLPKGW